MHACVAAQFARRAARAAPACTRLATISNTAVHLRLSPPSAQPLSRCDTRAACRWFCAASPPPDDAPDADTAISPADGGARGLILTPQQRNVLNDALRPLYTHAATRARAQSEYNIDNSIWMTVVAKFRRRMLASPMEFFPTPAALSAFVEAAQAATARSNTSTKHSDDERVSAFFAACLPLVSATALKFFEAHVRTATAMRASADLRAPHLAYPRARRMKRVIHFHAGPTNSGKTYHALRALSDAHAGAYAGPLRLLALEVYESLNMSGCPASLATGQERKEIPFARHVSSTIEMVDLNPPYPLDVAVIDEIQMIADAQRGAAWTRALLGVPAPQVHVCGDPAALPVIQSIASLCGDELQVHNYTRLTPMTPLKESLDNDYSRVTEGDCIVAFSRKDIYAIRRVIERKTAHKCCVIYGSLPPETRSQQARLFNDSNSGFRVLVASDAIGMGLNLNIRRVVFHTMDKFDGDSVGPVPPAQVKQIAGRAGRARSSYPHGYATTLSDDDIPYLHSSLATPTAPITHAGMFPNGEQLAAFSEHMPANTPLAALIDAFVNSSQLDGPYFMCRADDMKTVATYCQPFPLTLAQRCALCLAPANLKNQDVRAYFLKYLEEYSSGRPVRLELQLPFADSAYLIRNLESLEAKVQALDVYMWLAHRLGVLWFPDLPEAVSKRNEAGALLESALTLMSDETKADWERSVLQKRRRLRLKQLTAPVNNERQAPSSLQRPRTEPRAMRSSD